ncbi:hypothetical protein N3K66_006705 [Trichothecium roseum]|uniref:Uncharacterized protein n=1 Tax=Trichothecium roseum TaxID=47278 RepID=A0ACC0UXS7_9HYPO|nr:hypothetical protein N3K66_006705 [Trichothecium roseum]
MVLAKSKNTVGLGNSLMNDRFGKGKGGDRKKASAVARTNHVSGEQYVTNAKEDAAWVKMRSVTEQGALDEFLATAELAGTDFTAEKLNNVKIVHTDQRNPYLLSAQEERVVMGKHRLHKKRLTVPRRPKWDSSTTPSELDVRERESFLNWRRGLAELQENNDLLMTPFERNLEVWRQLWRVIERSDLVVQIVDARNPLLYRSEDLEAYVKEVDPNKANLLLINKADMLTDKQRASWAKFLREQGVAFKFFSAELAKELNETRDAESEDETPAKNAGKQPVQEKSGNESDDSEDGGVETNVVVNEDDTKILTIEELEDLFLSHAPKDAAPDHKLGVGLIGYPNVGKSSTINALVGAKKVSVSATPGKTKHFQTIHLSENVILCDCPGLVFPNFANTKADLVCNGVLPIDQMREYVGPVGVVTRRIPRNFLDAIYGITIKTRPIEEGGTGVPTAEELLRAYAAARGYYTQGLGQPDESRAARYVLKDYVNGKLLYVEPPPGIEDAKAFNNELYTEYNLPEKRRAALVHEVDSLSLETDADSADMASDFVALPAGPKSQRIDKNFFANQRSGAHVSVPFYQQYTEQGKNLNGRKAKTLVALENGIDPKDVQVVTSKKHFKGNPRGGKGKRRGVNLSADGDDD